MGRPTGNPTGRPRKIKTPAEMEKRWEEYKANCDNQSVLTHEFSAARAEFVSKELRKKITYTIEGFCVFLKLSRTAFYDYYASDERFADLVTRIKEECEMDARGKFETGQIPSQLSGLWMSRYGYGTNSNVKVGAEVLVNDWISGVLEKDGDS